MRLPALLLLVALGCQGGPPAAAVDGAPEHPALGPVRKLDLLVVMDDSAGVNTEGLEEVALALGTFLDELRRGPHGLPDLHLGVVSQDLGAGPTQVGQCRPGGMGGALIGAQRCGIGAGAKFLTIQEGGARTNASRPLEATLRCLAVSVGTSGCGFEHPLAAALLALSDQVPDNAGFARPDADLALFIHADEDDCSAPADTDLFMTEMPMQTPGFRCALLGHRCNGRAIPTESFEAPYAACDDEPRGGGKLDPVGALVSAARTLRPGRRLFVAGVIGVPIPGDPGTYRVTRGNGNENLWLNAVCGQPGAAVGWVGSAAPTPRLARFIRELGGSYGSLCDGPSHHTVARELAVRINEAR